MKALFMINNAALVQSQFNLNPPAVFMEPKYRMEDKGLNVI